MTEFRVDTPSLALPQLLQALVRMDTTNPPGNERQCIDYLDRLLTEAGFETKVLGRVPERPNLVTRLKGQGTAPPLLLYGHVDVVTTDKQDWQHPPFQGDIIDGYLWGRGTLDMKGGIVMMLAALLRAKAENAPLPGDVVLALVSDEEAGGFYGARYLVENHADLFKGIRYAIGELGGFSFNIGRQRFYPIMVAEKQVCRLRATVRGPGGHASLPGRGGVMAELARMLERLDRKSMPVHVTPAAKLMVQAIASNLPFPSGVVLKQLLNPKLTDSLLKLLGPRGKPFEPLFHHTVNPTIVRSGEKINVIPSEAVVDLDGRLLPGFAPEDMISEVRRIVGDQVELEVIQHDPGAVDLDMGLFGTLATILKEADPDAVAVPMLLPGSTDGRLFARLGIQTYGFLPVRLPSGFDFSETIHGANERIPVEGLTFGADAIFQLLCRFDA